MYIFLVRSVHVLSILEESVYGVGGRGRSKTLRLKITSAAQNYFHIWAVPVQSHVFMLSQKKNQKKKNIYMCMLKLVKQCTITYTRLVKR